MSGKRNGPGGQSGSAPEGLTAAKPLNHPQSTDGGREMRGARSAAADALADVWVLVVQPADGRYRRRVFLSVEPAWQAARRAADRGQRADVVLCRLEPLCGDR